MTNGQGNLITQSLTSQSISDLSIQMSASDPHRQTVDGTGGLNVTNDLTFIPGSPVPRLSHSGDVALAIGGDIGVEVIWRQDRLVSGSSNTCLLLRNAVKCSREGEDPPSARFNNYDEMIYNDYDSMYHDDLYRPPPLSQGRQGGQHYDHGPQQYHEGPPSGNPFDDPFFNNFLKGVNCLR